MLPQSDIYRYVHVCMYACISTSNIKRPYKFFFSPPAHLCAVTYITEISLNVMLSNQSIYQSYCYYHYIKYLTLSLSIEPKFECGIESILLSLPKHSGSIPRNACVALHDYQESVTTGQTDRQTHTQMDAGQSDPYVPLCFAGDTKTFHTTGLTSKICIT